MSPPPLDFQTFWEPWYVWLKFRCVFFSGECSCLEGLLPHIGEEDTLSCYQEFLQGPCKDGEQYVTSGDLDTLCEPTNCEENKTRFNETCFTIPTCGNEKFVEFPLNTNSEPKCVDLAQMDTGSRTGSIIGGRKAPCKDGFAIGPSGNCEKLLQSGSSRPMRSQPSKSKGNLRCTCCPPCARKKKTNKNKWEP